MSAYLYRKNEVGVTLLSCRSLDDIAVIPEEVDGVAVTELDDYIFSSGRAEPQEGTWTCEEDSAELPELKGSRLRELYLPSNLKKIGNYAFYNCWNLEKLSCASTTLDWGAGAFTGCKAVKLLDIRVREHEKSCLQEILSELRQTLTVYYHGHQEARLIFPEFFEESVENTPARILETHMHGCGHRYRYCFQQTEFQFHGYDDLFSALQAQEPEALVIRLTLGRLRYPYELSAEHRQIYEAYLLKHKRMAAVWAVREADMKCLAWLLKQYSYDREDLGILLEEANLGQEASVISFLMDLCYQQPPRDKKRFEL